jgi:hypothetical protein
METTIVASNLINRINTEERELLNSLNAEEFTMDQNMFSPYIFLDFVTNNDVHNFKQSAKFASEQDIISALDIAKNMDIIKFILDMNIVNIDISTCYLNLVEQLELNLQPSENSEILKSKTMLEKEYTALLISNISTEITELEKCVQRRLDAKTTSVKKTWTEFEKEIHNKQKARIDEWQKIIVQLKSV